MGLTISDIEKLESAGKIRGYKAIGGKSATVALSVPKNQLPEREGIAYIRQAIENRNIPYKTEYKFLETRRFKFDFALPQFMLYVEYEGLTKGSKKGGHQTMKGYTANTEKYNLAAINGWTGLRYTFMNYKDFDMHFTDFLMNIK